ncbi:hypothetical protein [cf. Phormidesmis sp. LEGE 11477]|uniref:hypothetical protein n=1 Tax=cf. Phormidesmis sp. LEGE 11477 TaxID=1828680 RepID=UPI00188125BE|nr:hypothetical protein [cf. Phormidesmis sp. LEGE 11477]MBE9061646.1 hypothetical protein [cf. Phormidesmis sp. LEGE 11477]
MADPKDSKLTEAAMAPETDTEQGEVAKPEESNTAAEGAAAEIVEDVNSVPGDGAATAAPADPEAMAMTTPKADEE